MTLVHVNVPYTMLLDRIDFVLQNRIHPEIYFSGEDLDSCKENDVKQLAEILHRHALEVTVHGPFMDLSPGGEDPKIKRVTQERILQTMALASLFKSRTIVFHPGYEKWKFDGNVKLWLDSSLRTWQPLVGEAEKTGLVLAIENVFEERPDSLLLLLEKINSPNFRFCFDTGHHHVFSRVGLPVWVDSLGEYLAEVHLHDNHHESDEHLPVGEGGFDFDAFFKLLSSRKLQPIYTIEPHEEEHLWRGLNALKKYIPMD